MSKLDLVVARFQEDVSWTRRIPGSCRAVLYDKSGHAAEGTALPNVGRETHTYLHHLVTQYERLADVTVFCQGKPFDHEPRLHRILRHLAKDANRSEPPSSGVAPMELLRVKGFLWLGFIIDRDDREGSLLFQRWTDGDSPRPLDMDSFWRSLWADDVPDEFIFYPGGQFAVTANRVHQQPRSFYERALEVSTGDPDVGHCFERCWDRVFGVDGIPTEFRDGAFPVYLRPIRRLGITWASVPPQYRGW